MVVNDVERGTYVVDVSIVVCAQMAYDNNGSSVGKFGWREVFDMQVPFIKRDDKDYMLINIVEQAVGKKFGAHFSNEVAACVKFPKFNLTAGEAALFNEINVEHCDSMFSKTPYTTADSMVELDDVQALDAFLKVCYRMVFENHKTNELFGFVRVNGENSVPFVWSGSRKLVPVIYFDGEAEFFEDRSVLLTDRWKMVYLRFCCKVHDIRPSHYNVAAMKVVDLEDVYPLFPADTKFEDYWPEQINEALLSAKGAARPPPQDLGPIRIQSSSPKSSWPNLTVQVCSYRPASNLRPTDYQIAEVSVLNERFTSITGSPSSRALLLVSVNEFQKKLAPQATLQDVIFRYKELFRTFYLLNPVQKNLWQQFMASPVRLHGHFNDLFVDSTDANAVAERLSETAL
ncbi:uncharacterized protein LOC132699742 [Cylas formicarius]|uniref:uncharacterized protein LOC132699742 n=1 Tax=Cylas formicarius TaxID=197179 RepID=UPI0029586D4B|nr:uncharacterized protein LOC132699742 [Cylas formicarius]